MQVYRARVLDAGGEEVEVAVKVVHPGLRQNLHRVSRTLLLRTIKLNLSYLFNQSFNLPSAVFFISALNSLFFPRSGSLHFGGSDSAPTLAPAAAVG